MTFVSWEYAAINNTRQSNSQLFATMVSSVRSMIIGALFAALIINTSYATEFRRIQDMFYQLPESLALSADNMTSTVVTNRAVSFHFDTFVIVSSKVNIFAKAAIFDTNGVETNDGPNPNDYITILSRSIENTNSDVNGNLKYSVPLLPLKSTNDIPSSRRLGVVFTTDSTEPSVAGFRLTHTFKIVESCSSVAIKPCLDASGQQSSLPPGDPYLVVLGATLTNTNKSERASVTFELQPLELEDFNLRVQDVYDLYYNGTENDLFESDKSAFLPDNLFTPSQKCLDKFVPENQREGNSRITRLTLQFGFENLNLALAIRRRKPLDPQVLLSTCKGVRVVVYPSSANSKLKCQSALAPKQCDNTLTALQWVFLAVVIVLAIVVITVLVALIYLRGGRKGTDSSRNLVEGNKLKRLRSKADMQSQSSLSYMDKGKSKSNNNLWYLQSENTTTPTLPSSRSFNGGLSPNSPVR